MEIQGILDYLNKNYNQNSPNYSIFCGAKPEVIRLDDTTAVSFWGCGAIVCDCDQLYFIKEDDGYWFTSSNNNTVSRKDCTQSSFSIGWGRGFADAMTKLCEYVEKNGEPVYFSGTNIVCHYKLKKK